ncbi:MAG TPA: glycosyltransferase family 1 protein [Ferruginibacter sp.]|nr:glycosyltransferase family 1 protein [Ferruginibacter sp.]
MTIAVSTGFLAGDQPDLVVESFCRLAQKYPQHHFLFISHRRHNTTISNAENVSSIITGPQTKNTLLLQYWFNYKLPAVLKKYKADVFVGMDGICSLRTKLPQCLVLQDISFLQHPGFFKGPLRFYKKFTFKFLTKAVSVATVSEFSKKLLTDKYNIAAEKIDVLYGAVHPVFKPISFEEKEKVKEHYTAGKEYFLFTGYIDLHSNLINLLKAFSFFKKRQKSNMMLLIAGKEDDYYAQFSKDLKTFKFRNEVKLLGCPSKEELAKITAAAYAFIYPVLYEDFAAEPLQAMQCGVPVVTASTGALPEICGEAALYADPADFKDIAEKMMLIFKDENKSKELGSLGSVQAQQYHWNKTSELLWQSILKAVDR